MEENNKEEIKKDDKEVRKLGGTLLIVVGLFGYILGHNVGFNRGKNEGLVDSYQNIFEKIVVILK